MKTLSFILLLFLGLFLITCKKDNSGVVDNTLTGRWKLTETYASIGGGNGTENYVPVSKTNQDYIIFNTNGTLNGTAFPNEVSYVLKDSVTIAITSKDNSVENYRYSIKNGVLQMSPARPIFCIEGCGQRFSKVR
jgi:hypothetical protein